MRILRKKQRVSLLALLATPAGWIEAFSFNLQKDGKPDYTLKSGTLTLYVPAEYQKTGRQFAIPGINKDGTVLLFGDTD